MPSKRQRPEGEALIHCNKAASASASASPLYTDACQDRDAGTSTRACILKEGEKKENIGAALFLNSGYPNENLASLQYPTETSMGEEVAQEECSNHLGSTSMEIKNKKETVTVTNPKPLQRSFSTTQRDYHQQKDQCSEEVTDEAAEGRCKREKSMKLFGFELRQKKG